MYKIIQDNKVIDVVKTPNFLRFLPSGHIAFTDKTSAQGITGSDNKTVYCFSAIYSHKYPEVTIAEISSEDEFKRLQNLLNSSQVISADESALAKAKQDKIQCLSTYCKNKIITGLAIKLSDGNTYKFKFTLEDQLNLMLIESQLSGGASSVIYHATEQPCKSYSREDMLRVINAFKQLNLYHTTYFNIAKQYINSLTDIDIVDSFVYGTDVSNATDDILLKQILKRGVAYYE